MEEQSVGLHIVKDRAKGRESRERETMNGEEWKGEEELGRVCDERDK